MIHKALRQVYAQDNRGTQRKREPTECNVHKDLKKASQNAWMTLRNACRESE